jgi:hypothetical protein
MSSFTQQTNETIYNEMIGLLPANHDDAMELVLRLQRFVYHQKARACETHYERMLHLSAQKSEERLRRLLEENARLVTERDAAAQKNNALQSELTKLDSIRTNLSGKNTVLMGETGRTGVSSPKFAEYLSVSELNGGTANLEGVVSAIDQSVGLDMRPNAPGVGTISSPSSSIPRISQAPYQSAAMFSPTNVHAHRYAQHSPMAPRTATPTESKTATPRAMAPGSAAPKNSPSLVTGKKFFRDCRARLKPVVFDAFLEVVKKLNRNELTREAAVEQSKEILGKDNMELVGSFRTLLFG